MTLTAFDPPVVYQGVKVWPYKRQLDEAEWSWSEQFATLRMQTGKRLGLDGVRSMGQPKDDQRFIVDFQGVVAEVVHGLALGHGASVFDRITVGRVEAHDENDFGRHEVKSVDSPRKRLILKGWEPRDAVCWLVLVHLPSRRVGCLGWSYAHEVFDQGAYPGPGHSPAWYAKPAHAATDLAWLDTRVQSAPG